MNFLLKRMVASSQSFGTTVLLQMALLQKIPRLGNEKEATWERWDQRS